MKVTTAAVNAELARRGYAERLVRGRGYWYFVDGEAHTWFSSSVPVYRITDLTLEKWIAYRNLLANDSRNG